jgi:hypothetical protein
VLILAGSYNFVAMNRSPVAFNSDSMCKCEQFKDWRNKVRIDFSLRINFGSCDYAIGYSDIYHII